VSQAAQHSMETDKWQSTGLSLASAGFFLSGLGTIFVFYVGAFVYPYNCTSPEGCSYVNNIQDVLLGLIILGFSVSIIGITLSRRDYRKSSNFNGRGLTVFAIGIVGILATTIGGLRLPTGGFGGPYKGNILILAVSFGLSFLWMFWGYFLIWRKSKVRAHPLRGGLMVLLLGLIISSFGVLLLITGSLEFVSLYDTVDLAGLGLLVEGLGWLTVGLGISRLRVSERFGLTREAI